MEPKFERIDDYRVRIAQQGGMRVPGLIFADRQMMEAIADDQSPQQVMNVAHLPGIVGHSLAMPDMHWGYGFPIGGVAAFDEHEGVLSPGGVGYDINCGVRLLRSNLRKPDVEGRLEELSLAIYKAVPCGVGSRSELRLSKSELDDVLEGGARWAVEQGLGDADDLEVIEEHGCFAGARPSEVSVRAKDRGRPQLGSLGSGNHFCELGYVAEIYDHEAAAAFGLEQDAITLLIHSGSRGLGHQICDDALHTMLKASHKYGIELPDRQLCAAPLDSPEARAYFGQMACAVNFAFANRQAMTHFARAALAKFFAREQDELGLRLVYDVCHNIAKWEQHEVDGAMRRLCVHRKGATRAFGPGHPDVPARYRELGQPVLVPGDMGRYSFVLAGTGQAMRESFGSSCHGAGRRMSRIKAKKLARTRPIFQELRERGVFVRADSKATIEEEMPDAYKDVADVVDVVAGAGLARKVAKLVPLAVVKG
ncbi:MAG: RtcB family protein [Deltaproteobacteria bacterium]|nr:RtcB family protein [Nannocystaceae bacterium]